MEGHELGRPAFHLFREDEEGIGPSPQLDEDILRLEEPFKGQG
jgi:hypothetical protein